MSDRGDVDMKLIRFFALTAGFMVVEFAGGLLAKSLALVADAGHMLTLERPRLCAQEIRAFLG